MRVLVIATHGDDEILGCGGTIIKHKNNKDEVHICYITSPTYPKWSFEYIKNRDIEIKAVSKLLNIDNIFKFDFGPTKLDKNKPELNDRLTSLIRNIKPDIVYIPFYGDLHMDHKVTYESCMVALRPLKHKTKKILMYEVLSETEWGKESFNPNVYVDITRHMMKKIQCIKCYDSELKNFPHPRSISGIVSLARKRGAEVNIPCAESFQLVREIS